MTKTELRERAYKAAKRLADARKVKGPPTAKRLAHENLTSDSSFTEPFPCQFDPETPLFGIRGT
jgi:hypothetical protein